MNWKKLSTEKPEDGKSIMIYAEGGFTQAVYSDGLISTRQFSDHGCGCCAEIIEGEVYWTYELPKPPKD